jgi:membrane protease YdiL (CAAX protease family)
MTSPIEPRTASLYHASRGSVLEPTIAAAIVMAAMASYLVVPQLVPSPLALIAAQTALSVIPVAAAFALHPVRPLAALGLRGARPRYFVAAIAVGATAWYANMRLVALLPLPEPPARALQILVERPSLLGALASFALVPAVCEELVFRGVLARSLGHRLRLGAAAAISAAVFSAYHLSVVQAVPTFTLGCLLAAIAIRADSVAPTMLAHAINNALALTIARGELPGIAGWLERNPTAALIGCAATAAGGIAIAVRGRP